MDNITHVRLAGALVDLLEGMGCTAEEISEVVEAMQKHIEVRRQERDWGTPPVRLPLQPPHFN